MTRMLRRARNAFWIAHHAYESKVKAVRAAACEVTKEFGRFDVAILACILLHLRDPFLAIQRAASVASSIIVVEREASALSFIPSESFPHTDTGMWWRLPPKVVANWLQVLGFGWIRKSTHTQKTNRTEKPQRLYTLVATRKPSLDRPGLVTLEGSRRPSDALGRCPDQ